MMNAALRCSAVVCVAIVCAGVIPARPADEVRVATGTLEGIAGKAPGIRAFVGIPYAAPPVGARRWKAPEPAPPWTGVRKADTFGNRCVQTTPFPDMIFQSAVESEDCLSLSIWTPAKTSAERLPVMVWIHGGGFFSGASDEHRHEGSALASKGVVLVEVNYRLGILGFLAHPALSAESDRHASGNYGLLDQVAALRWVHENIAAFGGNPAQVTIFGESAGSFSVSALMASPLTDGLFARAIGESGAYFSSATLPLTSLAAAEKRGADLAARAGAASIADLRAMPAADIIRAAGRDARSYAPIIDGYMLADDPWNVFAAGTQRRVPLLAGWNSAELKPQPTTAENFKTQLKSRFPNDEAAALAVYPAGSDAEASASAVALASDSFIGYNTWKWIEVHAATGQAPVYRYLFDQILPTANGAPAANDPGAAHATEIEFVFNTLDSRKLAWRAEDRRVADLIGSYWTNFAKTGNPNGAGLPPWPVWKAGGGGKLLRINASARAEAETHRGRYEFQDAVERRGRGK